MNKKSLTEMDVRTKFMTPAIVGFENSTKGRVIVRGETVKRGESKKADYLLPYKPNLPLAVVEAKDNTHSVGAGMQQALEYAETLDIPFAYSSNGDAFLEHDRTGARPVVEREFPLDQFWKKCPEVRHPLIGDWFRGQRLSLPWSSGEPHRFLVTKIGQNSFVVEMAGHKP